MIKRYLPVICRIILSTFIILLQGCSLYNANPKIDMQTQQLIARIQQQNHSLHTSRGTANLTLIINGTPLFYRMAWVAQYPRRLRMTLLSSGIPLETIAADGTAVTFVSHTGRHAPHTIYRSDPSLKSITAMPVKLSHIIALLTGRIPLDPFSTGYHTALEKTSSLALKNRWGKVNQEVVFDDALRVTRLQRLTAQGQPALKILFDRFQENEGFTLAEKFTVSDTRGNQLKVEITSMTPNIPLAENDRRFHLNTKGL